MTPTHARLFFALWPDPHTRTALADWQRAVHPLCGGRVMHRDDLHLTLAFLGDMPLELLASIKAAGQRVRGVPFSLRVDELRYWKHNKIVWAGLSEVPMALTALVDDLRAQLTAAGIRFDAKAFVPHITLLRNARPIEALPPPSAIDWQVEAFALIRSVGGSGPRYRVEASWPLRGDSSQEGLKA